MSLPTGRTLLSVHPGDKSYPREDGHRAAVPADDGACGPVRCCRWALSDAGAVVDGEERVAEHAKHEDEGDA